MDLNKWLTETRGLARGVLDAKGVRIISADDGKASIAFPYYRKGEGYAAKHRGPGKTFWSTKGVSRGLYNEDDLDAFPGQPIVITEGEIDCLSVIQSGFDRAVSVPDGWGSGDGARACLVEAEERLRASPFVVVAGDNDDAGESMPRVVAQILAGHDVRYVEWPEGCKDANDVLVQLGEGVLANCINAAKRIDPPGGLITGISDLPPLSERRVLRTGIYPFDNVIAFQLGTISVSIGIPGHGKSTFALWAAERVTVNEDVRAGFVAFETHPHDFRDQLALIRTGTEFQDLHGDAKNTFLEGVDRRFRLVHIKFDDDTDQHLKWLESMVRVLAVRDNCKLVVIDPWNELEHQPMAGESMTQYINFATKFLRQLAERLDIHIHLIVHPRKIMDGHVPNGYDAAESAGFFNKPSLGYTVHQVNPDDGEPYVKLMVWKVRNTRLYKFKTGTTKVRFDSTKLTYHRM